MKKIFFLLQLLAISYLTSSQTICVLDTRSSSGYYCTPSSVGQLGPCALLNFILRDYLPAPAGYSSVAKFEWFVNGVSVKSTTDPGDYGFELEYCFKHNIGLL